MRVRIAATPTEAREADWIVERAQAKRRGAALSRDQKKGGTPPFTPLLCEPGSLPPGGSNRAEGTRVKGSRDRPRKTKTEVPEAVRGREPVAVRDPRVARPVAAGAPPYHAVHALFRTRGI